MKVGVIAVDLTFDDLLYCESLSIKKYTIDNGIKH